MKLSELSVENFKVGESVNTIYDDSLVTNVVYSGINDDFKNNKWCIVFGNSLQVDERVKTVINKYKEERFEKIVLCGGTSGISNSSSNAESEASRYKKKLLAVGIPETCIYLEEESQNTFENIDNAMKIINSEDGYVNSLTIITSEYHLKRCYLTFAKKYPNISITMIPAYDGYSDRNNWFNSSNAWNTGRCMVTWERNLLTKYAKEGKILDCEINMKHEMRLNNVPYTKIKNGTKTIELRLNDEKRQLLKINDLIEFTNLETSDKILVEVEDLYYYPSFEELYRHFDKVSLGYDENEEANPKDMERYYSKEEQEKYGVLGIKIRLL